MDALIMAGGKGTRLNSLTGDLIPKPMVEICGTPLLERAVIQLKKYGVKKIYISVGHLYSQIISYFGNGENFGVQIEYLIEDSPLGSAGALYYLKGKVNTDFIVCSGDTVFDIDISRMLKFHKKRRADLTLFAHPNSHPYDSDLIITDRFDRVMEILRKNTQRGICPNLVNAGFFVVSPCALDYFVSPQKVNMEHDFIESLIKDKKRVYAYRSTEYIKDAGTPERFYKVQEDIKSGLVSARNLSKKQKAIFLDRDGTINEYDGFITTPERLILKSDAAKAVKQINDSGYLAIVVSNQPVVARGEATTKQVKQIFNKMQTLLGEQGAYVDAIYYCPHHPKKGFKGEVKRLKRECDCRKPKIGMLLKAQKQFNIDLTACVMVGDSDLDVLTGINAGIPSVKVKSGVIENATATPTKSVETLSDAVAYILNDYK